jgi:hypothetical protein
MLAIVGALCDLERGRRVPPFMNGEPYAMTFPPNQEDPRYAAVRQYSLAQILAVWAAAAIPMAVLAWLVAPLLGNLLGGGEVGFVKALLLCLTAGLIWQFVLTLILTRREQGTLRWSRVRDALWLLSPRDPRSGRVGGRVWLWVIPFVLLYGLWSFFGFDITGPSNRDFGEFLDTASGQEFFSGDWGWYAVVVVQLIFNSVLGEDLLFRDFCWRECGASSGGATSLPTGCCSPSTICTNRGRSPPPWRTSSLPPIPRGGGRACG